MVQASVAVLRPGQRIEVVRNGLISFLANGEKVSLPDVGKLLVDVPPEGSTLLVGEKIEIWRGRLLTSAANSLRVDQLVGGRYLLEP